MAAGVATGPIVLAVDIGSSATRGCLFGPDGRPLGERAKRRHEFTTDADGAATVDPTAVADEVAEVIDELLERSPGPVSGVALDTFASSLVGVDARGAPLTPCFTYADSRSAAQVEELRAELDESDVQQRTGCRFHTSYLPARLFWLRSTQPDLFGAVRRWVSLGEFVHVSLLGTAAAGTSTAAWTGMLDRRTGRWDAPLLQHVGIGIDQLSPVADPDRPYGPVDRRVSERWPQLADAVWFAPIADGLASNIGLGAADGSTVALTAGTSGAMRVLVHRIPDHVPTQLWCYRVDAQRSLIGGALNDVGRAMNWVARVLDLDGIDLGDVAAAPPDDATPLMVPFLTGERSTGWAARARASYANISAASTAASMARGALEGVAISYRRIAELLAPVTGRVSGANVPGDGAAPLRIHGGGGLLAGIPSLAGILADALGLPVVPVATRRTTLRGAALLALEALAPGSTAPAPDLGPVVEPNPAHRQHYDRQAALFERAIISPDGT
jgi:gluconokinase